MTSESNPKKKLSPEKIQANVRRAKQDLDTFARTGRRSDGLGTTTDGVENNDFSHAVAATRRHPSENS